MPKLNSKKIESLLKAGRHGRVLDGQGLFIQLRGKRASWILRYVSPVTHRTRECGLGSVPQVGLAEARQKAAEARVLVAKGVDPISAKSPRKQSGLFTDPSSITFGQAAEKFYNAQLSRWRNRKVREGWLRHVKNHTARIWQVPVDQVDQQLMVMVLQPLWIAKHVTARRIMHRVGQVLDFSRIMGWRTGANPARFKGELEYALPKRPANVNVKHLAAVPLADLPALMARLSTVPGTAALAARFCILTATRPGETFGAMWEEIDLGAKVWVIPGVRYKTGKPHTVPLSAAAVAVLADCPRFFDKNPFVFVSPMKPNAPLSNMACIALFKRLGVATTLHGTARSTFSDWAHDFTEVPHEIIEECLGHNVGNAVHRAYRRGAAIEKRRALLELWAQRCTQALAAVAAE